jgi:hypothetical protein
MLSTQEHQYLSAIKQVKPVDRGFRYMQFEWKIPNQSLSEIKRIKPVDRVFSNRAYEWYENSELNPEFFVYDESDDIASPYPYTKGNFWGKWERYIKDIVRE